MKVIAEGCVWCELRVDPQGEREGPNHYGGRFEDSGDFLLRVFIDGLEAFDVCEVWVGTPGRVIRCSARLCPCRPSDLIEGGEVVEIPRGGLRQ